MRCGLLGLGMVLVLAATTIYLVKWYKTNNVDVLRNPTVRTITLADPRDTFINPEAEELKMEEPINKRIKRDINGNNNRPEDMETNEETVLDYMDFTTINYNGDIGDVKETVNNENKNTFNKIVLNETKEDINNDIIKNIQNIKQNIQLSENIQDLLQPKPIKENINNNNKINETDTIEQSIKTDDIDKTREINEIVKDKQEDDVKESPNDVVKQNIEESTNSVQNCSLNDLEYIKQIEYYLNIYETIEEKLKQLNESKINNENPLFDEKILLDDLEKNITNKVIELLEPKQTIDTLDTSQAINIVDNNQHIPDSKQSINKPDSNQLINIDNSIQPVHTSTENAVMKSLELPITNYIQSTTPMSETVEKGSNNNALKNNTKEGVVLLESIAYPVEEENLLMKKFKNNNNELENVNTNEKKLVNEFIDEDYKIYNKELNKGNQHIKFKTELANDNQNNKYNEESNENIKYNFKKDQKETLETAHDGFETKNENKNKFKRENSKDILLKLKKKHEKLKQNIDEEEDYDVESKEHDRLNNKYKSMINKNKLNKKYQKKDYNEEDDVEEIKNSKKTIKPYAINKIKPKSILQKNSKLIKPLNYLKKKKESYEYYDEESEEQNIKINKLKPRTIITPKPKTIIPSLKRNTIIEKEKMKNKINKQTNKYVKGNEESDEENDEEEEHLNENGLPDIVYIPFKNNNNLDVKSLLLLSNAISNNPNYINEYNNMANNENHYQNIVPNSYYNHDTNIPIGQISQDGVPIVYNTVPTGYNPNEINYTGQNGINHPYHFNTLGNTLPHNEQYDKRNLKTKRKIYEDEDSDGYYKRRSFLNLEEPTREIANIVKSFQDIIKKNN